jgi:hypothetical protein
MSMTMGASAIPADNDDGERFLHLRAYSGRQRGRKKPYARDDTGHENRAHPHVARVNRSYPAFEPRVDEPIVL